MTLLVADFDPIQSKYHGFPYVRRKWYVFIQFYLCASLADGTDHKMKCL